VARYAAVSDDPVRLGLAGFLVALITVAIIGLVTLPTTSGATIKNTANTSRRPSLPPHEVDGRVLQHFSDAGFLGVVVDPRDRALLHVVVAKGTRILDCNIVDPQAKVTSETGDNVRIVVAGYQYVPRATAANGLGGTTCVSAGSASVSLRLKAPLGARRLYEGAAPSATTVADPTDFPAVAALPAGYTAGTAVPVNAATGNLVASREYVHGPDRLIVRVGSRFTVLAPGSVESATTVAGQYASVTHGAGQRCITWTELSGRVRQVCSTARAPLGAAALTVIARTLR
jgi:hypothetical protein